jgi:phospholipid/cholesterol/gamma-HCH transport system substrate-binding protein/paraquat-inducible protein B
MGTQASYVKIGVFVIAALVVLIVGLILLGAGALGGPRVRIETYLDESVQGLSVGSPVMRRGVKIGEVEDITFVAQEYGRPLSAAGAPKPEADLSEFGKYVMVVMSVDPRLFPAAAAPKARADVARLVDQGLRLKLSQQGVTGIAYIEMEYVDPESHPHLEIAWTPKRLYIPSTPSTLTAFTTSAEKVFDTLEEIDFVGMAARLDKTVGTLNRTLEDVQAANLRKEVLGLIAGLRRTNRTVNGLLDKTTLGPGGRSRTDVAGVLRSLDTALQTLTETARAARVAQAREEIVGLVSEVRETNKLVQQVLNRSKGEPGAGSLPGTMAQLTKTMNRLERFMEGRQSEVEEVMGNLEKATANLRRLTETAKKYPSHVLFGEPPPKSETVE